MVDDKINKRIAIVPGSFDPMTLGHLDVIKRACELFDRVVVAIMINPNKIQNAMFSFEQKEKIAALTCKDLPSVSIVVREGMLWELARDLGACAIVKGVRNAADLEYEVKMAEYNRKYYPQAQTVFLPASDEYSSLSSTEVRNALKNGIAPDGISPDALEYISTIIAKNK